MRVLIHSTHSYLENKTDLWLKDGDRIKLKIERLGELENTIKLQ